MYSMMYSMYVCIRIVCGREYTTNEASLKQKPCMHFSIYQDGKVATVCVVYFIVCMYVL